jgi:hypothetical protein
LVSVKGSESRNCFPAEWREILVESGFSSDLRKISSGLESQEVAGDTLVLLGPSSFSLANR